MEGENGGTESEMDDMRLCACNSRRKNYARKRGYESEIKLLNLPVQPLKRALIKYRYYNEQGWLK